MRISFAFASSRLVPACLFAGLSATSLLSGCRTVTAPLVSAHESGVGDAGRAQMELIPPPSKNRYLAIKSLSSWDNPYLTVQGDMVTLHVLLADANTSDLGQGTLLRPVGARRQVLNVRMSDLPMALTSVPQGSWPYGRVVALEEANNTPAGARPQVRRNMEAAMGVLNDLGVVAYEWTDGGTGLR